MGNLSRSIPDDLSAIWLHLSPCFALSSSLCAPVPSVRCNVEFISTKKKEKKEENKVMCGAWKTPHRGQLQDSPARETMDWDGGPGTKAQGSMRH